MRLFRNASIQHQLAAVILAASCLALSLACLGFTLYERASFRVMMTSELSALAETLGANTAAALTFSDRKSAKDMLSALRGEKHIVAACLYDNRGKIFVEYRRPDVADAFKMPAWGEDGAQFDEAYLTLFRTVSLDQEKVGSIAIISDLSVIEFYSALTKKVRTRPEISAKGTRVLASSTFATPRRFVSTHCVGRRGQGGEGR